MRPLRSLLRVQAASPRLVLRTNVRLYAEEKPKDFPQAVKGSADIHLHPPPENPSQLIRPTENVILAVEALKKLTFVEVVSLGHELAKISGIPYDRFVTGFGGGYSTGSGAGAPAAASAPSGAEAEKKEEKKEDKKPAAKKEIAAADIKLVSFPEGAKFNVLREIRKLKPGMNLLESKKLVENLPQILAKKVPKEELKEWETSLKAAGAEFEFIE